MVDKSLVIKQLTELGFQPKAGTAIPSYRGRLKAGKVEVPVVLEIPDFSFVDLPVVRIDSGFADEHQLRGHLSGGNALCYTDENALVLDPFQPIASIRAVFELCQETLRELLHGNTEPAIRAEIASYWRGDCYYVIDDPKTLKRVTRGFIELSSGKGLQVVASSKVSIKNWAGRLRKRYEIYDEIPAVVIDGDIPSPPPLTNLARASSWLDEIVGSEKDWLFKNTIDTSAPSAIIIGSNGIVGFRGKENATVKQALRGKGFRKSSAKNLWRAQAEKIKIEKFYGHVSTHAEMISRNANSSPPLTGKRICLIGCGTIGGYLARMLVQSGAGTDTAFTLVDNQVFLPENVGRHLLGFSSVGKMKAEAMAQELLRDFPAADVEPIAKSANEMLGQFRSYDLIIDATGTERFSAALNILAKELRASSGYPPIVYSMIFGNGAAVQSFLDKGGADDACYQCLRPEYGKPWRYDPLKIKPAEVEVVVRPCSVGSFVPFGVEASVSAATLTLRQVLDFFSGDSSATLRTRAINPKVGIGITDKTVTRSPKCPACSVAFEASGAATS
ncbi:MAG: ThiF family adenylyltransferase [Ahrensia sp.]|nr:ThiF family adenylyltransferase [Ahrensia sp.]